MVLDIEESFALTTGEECRLTLVRDVQQLRDVGRFRYEQHVVRLQKPAMHADHERHELIEPLDARSTIIVAEISGNIVGVVRVSLRPSFAEDVPWMSGVMALEPPDDASYVSRLLVHEEYRGTVIAKQLFLSAFKLGASTGIARCYVYSAPALIRYYERWGFVRMAGLVDHPDDGEQVALRLDLCDVARLRRIGSPFRACLGPRPGALPPSLLKEEAPEDLDLLNA